MIQENRIVEYKTAETDSDYDQAKILFREYAASLAFDLSFQDFEKELVTINSQYHKPEGALIVASVHPLPVGCVGIRKLDTETAELKRMYVQPEYRGYQIGVELLKRSLTAASGLGYKKIRLDTVQEMVKAQKLYKSFGFYEIPPYRYNPIPGTIYMEKIL